MGRITMPFSMMCLFVEEILGVIALAEALFVKELSCVLRLPTPAPSWGFGYMGLCMLTSRPLTSQPLTSQLVSFSMARFPCIGPRPARLLVPIRTRVDVPLVPLGASYSALFGLRLIEWDELVLPLLKHSHHVHHTFLKGFLELGSNKSNVGREERLGVDILYLLRG